MGEEYSREENDEAINSKILRAMIIRQRRFTSYKEKVILEKSESCYAGLLKEVEGSDGLYVLACPINVSEEVASEIERSEHRRRITTEDELNLEGVKYLLVENIAGTIVSPDPPKLKGLRRLSKLPKEVREWLKQLR